MRLLPLEKLGAIVSDDSNVHFGLYLPWVKYKHGFRLFVKIIHAQDQYIKGITPKRIELQFTEDNTYIHDQQAMDYWYTDVDLSTLPEHSFDSRWGCSGTYLYRYELEVPGKDNLDWIVDPFAKEYGPGNMSAFTIGTAPPKWDRFESEWKTPDIRDLTVYEIHLHEFAQSIDKTIQKLPYLKDLGINCIEIMPTSNVPKTVDWGFEPIGHFGIDERFGTNNSFRMLVQESHKLGITVIQDVIYGHTGSQFAYNYIYSYLNFDENPFIASFGDMDGFGASTDYNRQFVRDFFYSVNIHLLETFHLDGFRYDCVPNYYDGFMGVGYSNLVYQTYQYVKQKGAESHWQKFHDSGKINLIQCAEQLEKPYEVIEKTYSNATWQNETLNAFKNVACNGYTGLSGLGLQLGLSGYHQQVVHGDDTIIKTAFQYFENHDHPRLLCFIEKSTLLSTWINEQEVILASEGNRSIWYKMQPYSIALLLAKGVPLLWEGQEVLEKYDVPYTGSTRIGVTRPVRWELFNDLPGQSTICLYRKLLKLRNENALFRRGDYYFYNNWYKWQSKGLLFYSRSLAEQFVLVAINFSDQQQYTDFTFPHSGEYKELLHGQNNLLKIVNTQPTPISIPGNYARVWLISNN